MREIELKEMTIKELKEERKKFKRLADNVFYYWRNKAREELEKIDKLLKT